MKKNLVRIHNDYKNVKVEYSSRKSISKNTYFLVTT